MDSTHLNAMRTLLDKFHRKLADHAHAAKQEVMANEEQAEPIDNPTEEAGEPTAPKSSSSSNPKHMMMIMLGKKYKAKHKGY